MRNLGDGEKRVPGSEKQNAFRLQGGTGSWEVGGLFHFSACSSISLGFIAMKIAAILINYSLFCSAVGHC